MGGVICQSDDRKKNPEIKNGKSKIDDFEEISEAQNKERENSPSKNNSNHSPKKKKQMGLR